MDTKRYPSTSSKKSAANQAKRLIKEYDPHVVIAVDDNAQVYLVKDYPKDSKIQFVFCGVNADPKSYGYPADNVTGILERVYAAQVLQMLRLIQPAVKSVAFVNDDSATGNLIIHRTKEKADNGRLPVPITQWVQPSTFAQWQQAITRLENDKSVDALLIPLYHTVREKEGGPSILAAGVMRWTVANTSKPILGYWPFSVEDGALCAVVVDPYEHGKVAALMSKQILAGKKAGDLPIVTNIDGYVIVNLKTADHLNIDMPFEVLQSADKIIE